MADSALTTKKKETLRRYASTSGAKSYAEWLGTQTREGEAESLLAAEREGRRSEVGYGAAGEQLSGLGLADDGYAAYLRHAAKAARETRLAELTSARASRETAALAGYADYLRAERAASGDSLIAAAEQIADTTLTREEAEAIAKGAGGKSGATGALMNIYRYHGTTQGSAGRGASARSEIVAYLASAKLPYERAYTYCLSMGCTVAEAERLAATAVAGYDDTTKRLHALFEN